GYGRDRDDPRRGVGIAAEGGNARHPAALDLGQERAPMRMVGNELDGNGGLPLSGSLVSSRKDAPLGTPRGQDRDRDAPPRRRSALYFCAAGRRRRSR